MADLQSPPPSPALPSELPVVPLRGAVVLPMTVAPLGVSRPMSVEAINRALAGDRMVLLLLQKGDADEPGADDLHRVGTVGDHPADGQGARPACACSSRGSRARARSSSRTTRAICAR